jgi:hypothetical protein
MISFTPRTDLRGAFDGALGQSGDRAASVLPSSGSVSERGCEHIEPYKRLLGSSNASATRCLVGGKACSLFLGTRVCERFQSRIHQTIRDWHGSRVSKWRGLGLMDEEGNP